MALTANLTGKFGTIQKMEQWRVDGLRQLGIDFSKTAPCQTSFCLMIWLPIAAIIRPISMEYYLLTVQLFPKGRHSYHFSKKVGFFPNRVIFIDDREDNLKSLEAAIQKLDRPIEYQGFHYLGAQKYPSKMISEEEFESRWQKLASEAKELN